MDWKLELVAIPVSDVDRAKAFYAEQVGFVVDHDHRVSDDLRFVQLTPPGSGCSIAIGTGVTDAAPGSVKGMQLVVSDIEAAHATLSGRGVAQEEHTGPHRTAVSVAGGLSVGSSGSPFPFGGLLYGQGLYDGGASFSVGGTIAHDVTPRLTVEANGLYQDRGASAWSAVRLAASP